MLLGVSGRVRPNSGIGVIQRMVYPLLAERFHVQETTSRDVQARGLGAKVRGVVRGFAPVDSAFDAYFCLVSPIPVRTPKRMVAVVHDLRWQRDPSPAKRRYRAWDLRRIVNNASAIVCVSQTTQRALLEQHPGIADRVHVARLGPGIVPDETKPQPGEPGHALLIGPAEHKKNELAAQVMARMDGRITAVTAVNVSPATAQILRDRFGDAFEGLGRVDDAELIKLYQRAQYYVLLGSDEGFGLPYIEALRCGAQVVAVDIPLTREVLGPAGILLNGDTADELAQAWRSVPDVSPDIRAQVSSRYSWAEFAEVVARLATDG